MNSKIKLQFEPLQTPVGMPTGLLGKFLKKFAATQLTNTARHEAAHGTVATLLGVPLRYIDIRPAGSVGPDGQMALSFGVVKFDVERLQTRFEGEALLSALSTVAAAGIIADDGLPVHEYGAEADLNDLKRYAGTLEVQDFDAFETLHKRKAEDILNADHRRVWMHLTHALKAAKYLSGCRVEEVVARAKGHNP